MKKIYILSLILLIFSKIQAVETFKDGLKYPIGILYTDSGIYCADFSADLVYKISEEGKIIAKSSRIDGPSSIVTSDAEEIFVSSFYEHCIYVYDKNLQIIRKISAEGRNEGSLYYPIGIALNGEKLYVADYGNYRVDIFHISGAYESSLVYREKGRKLKPRSIAVRDELLFILCADSTKIYVSNFQGKETTTIDNVLNAKKLRHIKTGPLGYFYITDHSKQSVIVFDYDNKMARMLCSDLEKPEDVSFGPEGKIYITDSSGAILYYEDDYLRIINQAKKLFEEKKYKKCLEIIANLEKKSAFIEEMYQECMKSVKKAEEKVTEGIKADEPKKTDAEVKSENEKTPEIPGINESEPQKTEKSKTPSAPVSTQEIIIVLLIGASCFLIYKFVIFLNKNRTIDEMRRLNEKRRRREFIPINEKENSEKDT